MVNYVKIIGIIFLTFVIAAMTACSGASESSNGSTDGDEGQKGNKQLTIGVAVGSLANPFFVSMGKGAEEAGKELGAEVLVESAEYDLAKQAAQN